ELADRRRRVTTAPEGTQCGHARIIPATHMTFINQQFELALAGYCVVQVQSGKFVLTRFGRHRQVLQEPLAQRAVILELQSTDRMTDPLDGVRLTMGEVIAGIYATL